MLNKRFDTDQLIAQLTAVHHYSKGIILRQKRSDCKTERQTRALNFLDVSKNMIYAKGIHIMLDIKYPRKINIQLYIIDNASHFANYFSSTGIFCP